MEKKKKTRFGRVLSNRMDKTVVVEVESRRQHSHYKKVVRHKTRFKAHDEGNTCGIGDLVRIVETRPLSREKRWRVAEVLVKAETVEVKPEEIE
jgi:small subunit ribosomal protein S17